MPGSIGAPVRRRASPVCVLSLSAWRALSGPRLMLSESTATHGTTAADR